LDREGDGGVEDRRGRDGAGDVEMGWRQRVALDWIAEMIAASRGVDAERRRRLQLGEVLMRGAGVGEEQRTVAPPIPSSSTSAAMGGGGDEEAGNTAAATAPSTPSSSAALGGGGDDEAGGAAEAMAVGEVGKCRRRWRGRQRRLDSKWKGKKGLRIAVEAGRESGVVRGA
jgi:hypothetical protein